MKVFLSHSTKDKQFVQTLAAELETEKIEPWLCEVDIEFGDNFVAKIEEGLRDADLAVLFWSPEAAVSAWTRLEWTSVTHVAEIAAELAAKLKLGVETKSPEEQIAAAKAWLAERRALLVLDDIWENDVTALVPGPPVSLLCASRRHSLPWISPTHSLEVKSFSRGEAVSIFRMIKMWLTTNADFESLSARVAAKIGEHVV